jgi:hypothetical protein
MKYFKKIAGKKQTNVEFGKDVATHAAGGGALGFLAGGVVKALTKKKIPTFAIGADIGAAAFGGARIAKGKSTLS